MFSFSLGKSVAVGVLVMVSGMGLAQAQERNHHRDRPLTITRRTGPVRGTGIEVRDHGNEVIAWGGFGANGYGYGRAGGEASRRAARNESVRARTAGLYGYGFNGLGGTGFDEDRVSGFDNPTYGNAYNSYVGYNGVPTAFAFGPAFASRHITDNDNDDDGDLPGPTPGELGYGASSIALGDTDD